ncbi:MAG: hypothetical protein KDA05_10680, partial [Phycisphaerales bacterium]|nr:hypothetical protein [Phycisphaerales bacterium]
ELLLGQGDMLFLSPRTSKLCRAQGTLVDDKEIRRVVRFMRDVAAPTFERQLVQLRTADADEERILESKNNSSASLAAAQEDPMFDRAVEIVLESKRGSVSLLQRRLAIGYTRASRLIDLMGIAGIIGEHKGSVAREVAITLDDWATMKRLANEEAKRLGIEGTLFEGTGAGGAIAVAPSGFATDLEDGVDLRAPERIDAEADLDMSVGGAGRAAGAGPLIGGRDADDDEAMDLSEPEDAAVATAPPPGRPAESDRAAEPPFEATPANAKARRAEAITGTRDTDAPDDDAEEMAEGDDDGEYEEEDGEAEEDEEYDEEADDEAEGDDEEYEDEDEGEDEEEEGDEEEEDDGEQEEDEADEGDEDGDEEYEDDEEYEEEEDDESEDDDEEDPDAEDADDSDTEESDDEYEYEYEYVEVEEDEADEAPEGDADGADDDASDAEPPQVNIPAPRPAASPKGRRKAG